MSIDLTPVLLKKFSGYPKKVGRYSVSDMWAILNGYLSVREYLLPKKVDSVQAFRMWQGVTKHNQVQEFLKEIGWECEVKREREIKGFEIVGKVDAINAGEILEIKTSEELMAKAKRWHLFQAKIYCSLFERPVAYIMQPVVNSKVELKEIGCVKRDEEWFQEQMGLLEQFHEQLITYKHGLEQSNAGGHARFREGTSTGRYLPIEERARRGE